LPALTKEQLEVIIREQRPPSIASLKNYLKKADLKCSDEELIDLMDQLSSEGSIGFQASESSSFSEFLTNPSRSWWVYLVLLTTGAELLLVDYGPSNPFSVLFRQVLGLALLGFLPGYSTFRVVFPQSELTILERIVLSIFLSLLVSIISGTILGSVLLFKATTTVIVLTGFTFVMTLVASYRSFALSKAERRLQLSSYSNRAKSERYAPRGLATPWLSRASWRLLETYSFQKG